MKVLYKIINFPIYLVVGLITVICCISPIRKNMGKYDREEITHSDMLIEINNTIGKFPLMHLLMRIPEWLRAFLTAGIATYFLY